MSARARNRRRRSRRGAGRGVALFVGVLAAFAAIALGGVAVWVLGVASSAPPIEDLKPTDGGANSEIFDSRGNSLGFVQSDVLREPTTLKRIPDTVEQATIAIEDENFYEHSGVDYSAIVRAAVENLSAGEVKQGASTITQQLVRNLYIEDPEDTIERKIIEAEMAREYENENSKEEILEAYLNTATYGTTDGRSAIGVAAAADVFFDKNIKDVGLKEAALLAGLPQAPTDYNPYLNEELATERRNQVLRAMADQDYITLKKANELQAEGLGLQRGDRFETREEQYFFDYVQQELIDTYGQRKVRAGGLQVYTTLDRRLQRAAQDALTANPVTGAVSALVSTETDTGKILAMASSSTYDASQFNVAAQGKRQPGSSFKPFVLTTAVDQGIDPDSTYYPAPSTVTLSPDQYTSWTVEGGGSGSMSLRSATASSVNTVYAQLGIDVGPENFAEMAEKLGVESKLDGFYAEALGGTTECCTVLEMSNAYATLANGGVHHDPTAIERVEFPDGEVDELGDPEGERVISDGVAYTVADVMQGTLDSGTAAGYDIPCTASGKTGTTEEQADAWFVGYTPKISTAVWTGNPDARTPLPGYGADLSAPIWQDFMLVATEGDCEEYPEPTEPAQLSAYSSDQTISGAEYETAPEETDVPEETIEEAPVEEAAGGGGDTGAGGNGGGGGGNGGGGDGGGGAIAP